MRTIEDVDAVFTLVEDCAKVLAGNDPTHQGAALAELVSRWLCGWQVTPVEREGMLLEMVTLVRDLNTVNVKLYAAGRVIPPEQQH